MKILIGLIFSCLSVIALAQVWCPNPPGDLAIPSSDCCGGEKIGLGLFMRAYFEETMQIDCMLDIFFDALMFDDEVLDFYSYVSGPEFEELCVYIQKMPEWMDLTEYFCFELDFDPYKYLNTMGTILNIVHMEHPQGCTFEFPLPWSKNITGPTISQSSTRNRPARWPVTPENGIGGMVGLIDVLYYEINHIRGRELWDHHIATDPYLCAAVNKMREPYFRYMVWRIEQHPEYIKFYTKMNDYGVNFTGFVEELKKFLWESDDCT